MSVSTLDTPVNTSSNPNLSRASTGPEAKAKGPAPAAPSFKGHNATHVNFQARDNHRGPVFGNHQPAPAHQRHANHSGHHYGTPAMPAFLDQFKQWLGHCFGGHRPSLRPGCSNPPPRPMPGVSNPPPRPFPTIGRPYPSPPGRPDPQYSLKNNEDLAKQLRDNFNAFIDPRNPGAVTIDSIHAMAGKSWSWNPAMNENIRLANELLRRPDLLNALDRHSTTGALDGLIDRQNVNLVISGENYFKYKTDKELAAEMYEHFNDLKGAPWKRELNISDLKKLARQPLTGDSPKDHLIQLAQEVLKRSDALKRMDQNNDGRIGRDTLYWLSR
ncbi:EF-hand domain-containing protein [Pseudomonas sp. MPB23]|uniref:EF-hand domain-containing protein n=1 Tax=Pseudomonas sp. MPB23 TaxID=3388490 RepID=UPI00398523A5